MKVVRISVNDIHVYYTDTPLNASLLRNVVVSEQLA